MDTQTNFSYQGRQVMKIILTPAQVAILKATINRDLTPELDSERDRDLIAILDQLDTGGMKQLRGIKGVEGKIPIGCVVSVSRRDRPGGPPVDKKGFHILSVREDDRMRPQHPRFRKYNEAPWGNRQVLQGMIVHASEKDCFEWDRKAQVIRKPMHPHKRPHCVGDGVRAQRWAFDEPDHFLDIDCLNEKCEFHQSGVCKPFFRFVFLLTWSPEAEASFGFPPMLAKLTSRSWNSLRNFVGFFSYINQTARELGLSNHSLMGFPFLLEHTYETKPEKKYRYQVLRITPREEPVAFFAKQARMMAQIRHQYRELEAITDQSQKEPELVYEDVKSVEWGNPND